MDYEEKSEHKLRYDCTRCPAYCCSYDEIEVTDSEIARLARHRGIPVDVMIARHTKLTRSGSRVLRHQKDDIYGSVCTFLDRQRRRCTVYEARPKVCRDYPERPRCGYYEFLSWERRHQGDPDFIPLRKDE